MTDEQERAVVAVEDWQPTTHLRLNPEFERVPHYANRHTTFDFKGLLQQKWVRALHLDRLPREKADVGIGPWRIEEEWRNVE